MTTSERILAIRAKAGNPNTVCPTCGRKPTDPYRVFSGSKVLFGCVDAAHTGQLVYPSESARWHAQGEKVRKSLLAHLKSL